MAESRLIWTETAVAAADLSAREYHLVRYSASERVNQASEAVHSSLAGVLQNKPRADEFATVGILGLSKVVAGAAVAANVFLTTNASGRAIAASSGQMVFGRALAPAGANGEIITALIFPPFRLSGAT
jgi:hypothetical protein